MKILNIGCSVLMVLITCAGCNKTNTTKLYTGKVLALACPSYVIIQVTNANIGDDWNSNHNVIGISNRPDNVQVNDQVSFYINNSKNYQECLAIVPCPQDIAFVFPSKIYCASSISILK